MENPGQNPEPIQASSEEEDAFWGRHRLGLLLGSSVVITLVLTVVSMVIYNVSGAAQLDLSRPGYQSVTSQIEPDDEIDSFSSSGSVDEDTIKDFIKLYDSEAKKAKGVDAFNGDPLNPEVLEFGTPSN